MTPKIEISGLRKSFGALTVLRDINLHVEPGQVVALIGPSGSGKSTLLRCINLLVMPNSGHIRVGSDSFSFGPGSKPPAVMQQARFRSSTGMVFQHFNLFPHMTVLQNVMEGPVSVKKMPKAQAVSLAQALLAKVGLSDKVNVFPTTLSGGQKQRVGIARALASEPQVLLSDEATSALDPETTRSILELLKRINRELGLTIVLITHQMEVIKQVCDRVAVLDAGRVVEQGRVIEVFLRPRHDVTRALIGDVISQELPAGVRERVASRIGNGHDHLYRLAFSGAGVDQPLLSEAIRRYELDFNILHGQIDEIQGQAFGSLAVLAGGTPARVAEAMAFLASQGVVVEELSHVE